MHERSTANLDTQAVESTQSPEPTAVSSRYSYETKADSSDLSTAPVLVSRWRWPGFLH